MRIHVQKPLLTLIVATMALAGGCKKSPTEPGASANALDADSPVVQAMRSGAMPVCDMASSVIWRGVRHAPAGRAQLIVTDDLSPLIVNGIGSSGRDGFCTEYPVNGGSGAQGSVLSAKYEGIDGESNDANHGFRGEWETQAGHRYSAGFVMIPDNGSILLGVMAPRLNCRNAAIVFLLDGVVVGQGPVACATQGQLKGAYPIAGLGRVDVWEHWTASAAGYQWELSTGGDTTIDANLPGGRSLVVDEIRFIDPAPVPSRLVRSIFTATAGKHGATGGIALLEWGS